MAMVMAMAMVIAMVMVIAMGTMMTSTQKPPSTPLSPDEAHTMIEDITEITVSNSDNDQHLVQSTSARFDGRMPDIPDVEIWRKVSFWMFLLSHLFSLILSFFGSRPS